MFRFFIKSRSLKVEVTRVIFDGYLVGLGLEGGLLEGGFFRREG